MKNRSIFALAAALGAAVALTFGCSSDDSSDNNNSSGGVSSSSDVADGGSSSSVGGGSSSSVGGGNSSSFVDNGEGSYTVNNINDYRTVEIGGQIWMAENLNYYVAGSLCNNNNSANCNKYGRLYDWATTMGLPSSCNSSICTKQIQANHKGICPDGWHIPKSTDWITLMAFVGGTGTDNEIGAGKSLKANNGWDGTDDFDFSALPGGLGYSEGVFADVGSSGDWWSTTESNNGSAYARSLNSENDNASNRKLNKPNFRSVRCIKNSSSDGIVYGEPVEYENETYPTVVIGTQTWFAKNLNVAGGKCYGEDGPVVGGNTYLTTEEIQANCTKYGRLYDWETAMTACPNGWKLPSNDDWNTLVNSVGSDKTAGIVLKATSNWNSSGNGTNIYGFATLPGGYSNGGVFQEIGNEGYWWNSTEYEYAEGWAYFIHISYESDGTSLANRSQKTYLRSIRCIKD